MTSWLPRSLIFIASILAMPLTANADARIGMVIMHGKGGSPTKHVADLAASLEKQGFLVANLEMPWSGRRDYDVNTDTAEKEIDTALNALRGKGAQKLFVAGHSQGGAFALHFGSTHFIDGIIAIAPGGNVNSEIFQTKLGESVERARNLIAEGKADEKARLSDFEGSKGVYPVISTPSAYLTWFDPDGAMNQMSAVQNMNPEVPVLFIVPTRDYPGLLKVKQRMFDALPKNPRTRLYEPESSHLDAPSASIREITEWATAVANGP